MESTMDEQCHLHNELWKQDMRSLDWCNQVHQLRARPCNKAVGWNTVRTKNSGFSWFHRFIQAPTIPRRDRAYPTRLGKTPDGKKGRREQF